MTKRYAEAQKACVPVLQRVGNVDDVADIAVFLASDASGWITGQSVDANDRSFIS